MTTLDGVTEVLLGLHAALGVALLLVAAAIALQAVTSVTVVVLLYRWGKPVVKTKVDNWIEVPGGGDSSESWRDGGGE